MNKRPIIFIGFERTIKRLIVPDSWKNATIIRSAERIEGYMEADIFWVGDFEELPEFGKICDAVNRINDRREFIIKTL